MANPTAISQADVTHPHSHLTYLSCSTLVEQTEPETEVCVGMYTTVSKSGVSKISFLNTFIEQICIKLMESDIKYIYNVTLF